MIAEELESLFGDDFSDDDLPESRNFQPHDSSTIADSSKDSLITLGDFGVLPEREEQPLMDEDNILDTLNAKQIIGDILKDLLDRVLMDVGPLKRWRDADPREWAVNRAKMRRAEGLTYVIQKKLRPSKVPKPANCDKYQYRCNKNFTSDERNILCRLSF